MKTKLLSLILLMGCSTALFAGTEDLPSFAGRVVTSATAPVNGTNAVQTITIGGTPTGGTFTLTFAGKTTAAISWTSTDATLASNIQTALNALNNIGASGVVGSVGTGSSGIGTYLVTFSGTNTARKPQATMTVTSSLTGTSPTITVSTTTPGVTADGRILPKGTICIAADTGISWQNTGSPPNPTWVKVSSE